MKQSDIDALRRFAQAAEKHGHHIYTNPRDSNKWNDNQVWVQYASPELILELLEERDQLLKKTAVTLGVGTGDGQLFVHGDYDSIKAAQALGFRAELLNTMQAAFTDTDENMLHSVADYMRKDDSPRCAADLRDLAGRINKLRKA